MLNKLLSRQLKKYLPESLHQSDELKKFLHIVSETYQHYEDDRLLIERAMELSSEELFEANSRLKKEADREQEILQKLLESIHTIAPDAIPKEFLEEDNEKKLLILADFLHILIAEQAKTQHALQESEYRFRQIRSTVNDVFYLYNVVEQKYEFISDNVESTLGVKPEYFYEGKSFNKTFGHPEDVDKMELAKKHVEEGWPYEIEFRALVSGKWRWFREKSFPIKDEQGMIQKNSGIITDINLQKAAELQLMQASKAAEQANVAKSAFLSSMSHELRTPLNAIIGFSQILQKDQSLSTQHRSYIETMYRSGNHLLAMINDVLDISKIESGKIDLLVEPFRLPQMINDVQAMFALQCQEKRLDFFVQLEGEVPEVIVADSNRIQQVLINLVSNAVKYTKEGGVSLVVQRTDVAGAQSEANLLFMVRDTGRGIPPAQLKEIFEPFKQVRGLHNDGTGLGLSISSKLVQLMGGELKVESTEGRGSTFYFELPIHIGQKDFIESGPQEYSIIGIEGDKEWSVLIVDDVPSNRAVVRAQLEPVGMLCLEAANGLDAVNMARTFNPDIVLMDIMMPVMDGRQSRSEIALIPGMASTPVIALTASGSPTLKETYLQEGFADYIQKPFKAEWLFSSLEKVSSIRFKRKQNKQVRIVVDHTATISKLLPEIRKVEVSLQQELFYGLELQDFKSLNKTVDTLCKQNPDFSVLKQMVKEKNFSFIIELTEQLEKMA